MLPKWMVKSEDSDLNQEKKIYEKMKFRETCKVYNLQSALSSQSPYLQHSQIKNKG